MHAYINHKNICVVRSRLICSSSTEKRTYPVVRLLGAEVLDAAAEKGGTKDEEQVREHGAEQRALDNLDLTLHQREQRDDELRRVAAGRIQEPADCNKCTIRITYSLPFYLLRLS
jgi:hypothetical protein